MVVQMNRLGVIRWARENLPNIDAIKFPVNYCVKAGFFVPVTEDIFLLQNSVENGVKWHIDEVRRLSDKEMRDYNLTCRYRYLGRAIETPKRYKGTTVISGGIYVPAEAIFPNLKEAVA